MLTIIQNDPGVPLGSFADWLQQSGTDFRIHRAFHDPQLPPAEQCNGLILLGGKMGADETERFTFLDPVKNLLRQALAAEQPLLGICLGGQLLATAAGGRLTRNRHGERGLQTVHLSDRGARDPLLAGLGPEFPSFQWHQDSFDLPPGATHLARSPACLNQAFRLGPRAYGLQFHPEVNPAIVAAWGQRAGCQEQALADFLAGEKSYRQASHCLLQNFLRLL